MMKEENINCTIEALILASPEPLSVRKINEVIGDVSPARIRQGVEDLNNVYMGCGCSFRIREIAGGYQVHILPDFEQPIKNLLTKQRTVRLTRAALETLAIVAYKQPVTKTDIEHIRGVASDGVIHNLMERKLILIAGRAETPGRPLLYKTSQEFLKFFGLNRLSDLPRMDEIEEMIKQADTPKEQTVLEFGENVKEMLSAEDSEDNEDDDADFENADDGLLTHVELPPEQSEHTENDSVDGEDSDEYDEFEGETPEGNLSDMIAATEVFGKETVTFSQETDEIDEPAELEEDMGATDFNLPEARFEREWDDAGNTVDQTDNAATELDEDGDESGEDTEPEAETVVDTDEESDAEESVNEEVTATTVDTDSPRS